MTHDYDAVKRTTTQQRWVCRDCRRQWIWQHTGAETCPGCGSANQDRVEFNGLFDYLTDPSEIAAKFIGADVEREAAARAMLTGRETFIQPPPPALLASEDEGDELVGVFE